MTAIKLPQLRNIPGLRRDQTLSLAEIMERWDCSNVPSYFRIAIDVLKRIEVQVETKAE